MEQAPSNAMHRGQRPAFLAGRQGQPMAAIRYAGIAASRFIPNSIGSLRRRKQYSVRHLANGESSEQDFRKNDQPRSGILIGPHDNVSGDPGREVPHARTVLHIWTDVAATCNFVDGVGAAQTRKPAEQ